MPYERVDMNKFKGWGEFGKTLETIDTLIMLWIITLTNAGV